MSCYILSSGKTSRIIRAHVTRSIINHVVIPERGEGTNVVFAFVHVKRREVGLDAVIKRTSTSLLY